jgi:hypothetical protein
MQAEDEQALISAAPSHDALGQEWLTDVIDQLDRRAFQRALDRRHAAPSYRTVIESAQLVATPVATE